MDARRHGFRRLGARHAAPPPPETAGPNILLILVDDLGIDQLNRYDDQNYYTDPYPYANTPKIDWLVDHGVRFTQARANPLCSPTRAALQSGMYSFANGVGELVFGPNQGVGCVSLGFVDFQPQALTINATPLADVVRERTGFEYYTALIGKSHLGADPYREPTNPWCGQGPECYSPTAWEYVTHALKYDEFHGVLRGLSQHPSPHSNATVPPCTGRADDYFSDFYWIDDDGSSPAWRTEIAHTYYSAYEAEQVIQCMDTAPSPYLLVWCTIDPHLPPEWPPEEYHGFGSDPNTAKVRGAYSNTTFRAKLEYLDSMIAVVLGTRTPLELANLTIILMGDNGTASAVMSTTDGEESYPEGHPLLNAWKAANKPQFVSTEPYNPNHLKGKVYEGGIRVPLIVWGASVDASMVGAVSDQLVDVVDLHETIRDISYTGGTYPGPTILNDSQSFAWVLRNTAPWGGLPARDFSYSATFSPNTDFSGPNGLWKDEPARDYWKDCVIRQNSTTGKWYKMIRSVAYDSSTPPSRPSAMYSTSSTSAVVSSPTPACFPKDTPSTSQRRPSSNL